MVHRDGRICGKAFIYVYDYAVVRFRKWKWCALNNPKNPIVRYFITRRSNKMAEELLRQIQEGEAFKIEPKNTMELKMSRKKKVSYYIETIEKDDYVKYTGCSKSQVRWGNNDDPEPFLVQGGIYYVEKTIVRVFTYKTSPSRC